jgi:hypothetical protein
MSRSKFIFEQSGKYDFDTTVDFLVKEAELKEWKVPALHDLQQSLAKSGKTVTGNLI